MIITSSLQTVQVQVSEGFVSDKEKVTHSIRPLGLVVFILKRSATLGQTSTGVFTVTSEVENAPPIPSYGRRI